MPFARHSASWLIPVATFVAGAALAWFAAPAPAPEPPKIDIPTFGASTPATPAPANSANAAELALYRDINDKFVEQLRRYETRLRDIATATESEGAPDSAEVLRDFALETELLIDRYDLIVKKN